MNRRCAQGTLHVRRYRPGFGMTASQYLKISSSALCSIPRTRTIVPILPPGPTEGGELRHPLPSSAAVTGRSTNTWARRITSSITTLTVDQAPAVCGSPDSRINRVSRVEDGSPAFRIKPLAGSGRRRKATLLSPRQARHSSRCRVSAKTRQRREHDDDLEGRGAAYVLRLRPSLS